MIAIIVIAITAILVCATPSPYAIVQNHDFSPRELRIKAGITVTWINIDVNLHPGRVIQNEYFVAVMFKPLFLNFP